MLHFVTSYMKQNKSHNKTSRVRRTDWKSSLSLYGIFKVDVLVRMVVRTPGKGSLHLGIG